MNKQLTLSQAIEGYQLHARARRLSHHTLSDYNTTFRKFQAHLGADLPIKTIKKEHIREFLANQTVSRKTVLNYHTGLSALWTWAYQEGLVVENIVQLIARPRPQKTDITPLSQDDLRAILANLETSRSYKRPGKRRSAHSLPSVDRNRAIILLLLDTGIRSNELCELRFHQLDRKNSRITVDGKGAKKRTIPFSPRTGQALWRYLTTRTDPLPDDHIFLTNAKRPLTRDRLYKIIRTIGERARVKDVHPHRFRHTFAITYLRNQGDPWSLQLMLGHSTMEMVARYLAIAQADLDAGHRRASPVENWGL